MSRGTYCNRGYLDDGEKKKKKKKQRGVIPDPFPIGLMDNATKEAQLEEIRARTPRYLFRAWNNSGDNYTSGGHVDLNTIEAIIPLAFRHGRGHSNVYDLSRKDFATMVDMHVRAVKGDFKTELSSWTGSLSRAIMYALRFLGGNPEHCYISMIDTKEELLDQNQIFFVPDLQFLGYNLGDYQFEYLAHGVIQSHATRLSTFKKRGYNLDKISGSNTRYRRTEAQAVTEERVENARKIGIFYGSNLCLPMTLALLCVEKRGRSLFDQDGKELQVLLDGLPGLQFPGDWINDRTIMQNDVFTGGDKREYYPDLRQFIHLMRAVATHEATRISSQDGAWTEEPLVKIGGTSRSTGVTFDLNDEIRYFIKDYGDDGVAQQEQQPRHGGGYETRSRKRSADPDVKMQDVEESKEESAELKRSSRMDCESKRLRTEMSDEGKAREFGHYGNDVGAVSRRYG